MGPEDLYLPCEPNPRAKSLIGQAPVPDNRTHCHDRRPPLYLMFPQVRRICDAMAAHDHPGAGTRCDLNMPCTWPARPRPVTDSYIPHDQEVRASEHAPIGFQFMGPCTATMWQYEYS